MDFSSGVIEKILPRKNYLLRPPIANIDSVAAVISEVPKPDFILIDKIVIRALRMGIDCVLCINKSDMLSDAFIEEVKREYGGVADRIFVLSAKTASGISDFCAYLKDKIVCFAGQSAVGKSSLVNCIIGNSYSEIGEVSQRSGRGRHTTRHSELIPLCGGYLADTPGFTFFDGLEDIAPNELSGYYVDFDAFSAGCRFKGCSHVDEPVCGIKTAVEEGKLSKERYLRYLANYSELKDKWAKRY